MPTALRPLTTGELLDRTFSLYRSHFALFLGIVALPHLFLLAFQLVGATLRGSPQSFSGVLTTIGWGIGAALIGIVVAAASQAATVVAVSQVHLERPASVMDSYGRVKGRILLVVGLSLLMGVAIGLGCLLLLVPGIVLAVRWAIAVPAAVLENKGVGDSLSRSSELTKGNRWRILVILILFFVLNLTVTMLLQWPITIGAALLARGGTVGLAWVTVASAVAAFISQCLVGALGTIALSLVYYDQRVRKEAFDLQVMMATLDGGAMQVAPA